MQSDSTETKHAMEVDTDDSRKRLCVSNEAAAMHADASLKSTYLLYAGQLRRLDDILVMTPDLRARLLQRLTALLCSHTESAIAAGWALSMEWVHVAYSIQSFSMVAVLSVEITDTPHTDTKLKQFHAETVPLVASVLDRALAQPAFF